MSSISDLPIMNNIFDKDTKDRFWKFVPLRQAGECWNWDGYYGNDKYGQFQYNYKLYSVHRFSYIMHYGNIPDGLLVCHKCDNKRCVNPMHLYLGTHLDNIMDRIERDPKSFRAINYSRLTRKESKQMKDLFDIGYNYSEIGRMFKVHNTTAKNIITNKTTHFMEDRNDY